MNSVEESRAKVSDIRDQLYEVVESFIRANPEVPAQVLMGGLGEMLIQFSVAQVGTAGALNFIGHLKDAVDTFGGNIAREH